MGGPRLQLHSRYFKVAEATGKVHLKWLKIAERDDLEIERVIGILLEIAGAMNKALYLKPESMCGNGEEFLAELRKVQAEYGLTQGESLRILLEAAAGEVKYMIRHERHPNDPDKKGDEA